MKDKLKKVVSIDPIVWCPDADRSVSKLTVFNNDELIIENFKHVIFSDDERISVKTRRGILNIYGMQLKIDYYTSCEIKIFGCISSVDWLTV